MDYATSKRPASARASFAGLELRVPPLPQTLTEALEFMQHPEQLEIAPVTEMVQRDPVVVARLLNIVNSAYYGLRHQITSADRAVVMLGPVAVAGIVVGMQMLKLRELIDGPAGKCFSRLIRHSVATAFIARHLVEGSPRERRSQRGQVGPSFTAGLLHDFGKIILVYNYPEKAVTLYDEQAFENQIDAVDGAELEQLVFGYDHSEAGEFVARKLNFPDLLVDVVRHHHAPDLTVGSGETCRIVRAAAAGNVASKAMGYAFTGSVSPEECAAHPIWNSILTHDLPSYGDPEALVAEVLGLQEELEEYVGAMTAPDGR